MLSGVQRSGHCELWFWVALGITSQYITRTIKSSTYLWIIPSAPFHALWTVIAGLPLVVRALRVVGTPRYIAK